MHAPSYGIVSSARIFTDELNWCVHPRRCLGVQQKEKNALRLACAQWQGLLAKNRAVSAAREHTCYSLSARWTANGRKDTTLREKLGSVEAERAWTRDFESTVRLGVRRSAQRCL